MKKLRLSASPAFNFVLTMGIVNLFADIAYEGGGSLNGPFLGSLGASAVMISIIAGAGEFLGYSLRFVSGWFSDRTGKYWLITFIGYAINLLAVPAMALAGNWQVAAALVLAERIGRGIRKPTVEAMLSYTTGELGKGWVYGVNTALDEIGATIGPLLMALVLFMKGSYQTGFAILLVPAVLALVSLTAARVVFPLPEKLETKQSGQTKGFTRAYWLNMIAGAFFAAGLTSFELISFHLSKNGVVTGEWIPAFLALATIGGIFASLAFGRLYDRVGLPVLIGAIILSSLFSPLVFTGGFVAVLAGLMLWGIGYATQDTLLKAVIAGVLPEGKRNLAFGLFYTGYGSGWLIGSIATGMLYEHSLTALIIFCMAVQWASLPVFVMAQKSRTS